MIKQTFISLLLTLAVSFTTQAKTLTFGDGANMSKLKTISTVLANPSDHLNQEITVKGKVAAVCKKRGCWMELAAEQSQQVLKIKVKDGDMVFPVSAKDKIAYATGKLTGKLLDKTQTIAYYRHVAEENQLAFDPSSIDKGMMLYQLTPTGVTIND